jgi:hypothetical protein
MLHHAIQADPAPEHRALASCCSDHRTSSSAAHCPERDLPDPHDERHDCNDCVICDATNEQVVLTGGQLRLLEITGTAVGSAISFEPDALPAANSLPTSLPPPAPQALHSITLPLLN